MGLFSDAARSVTGRTASSAAGGMYIGARGTAKKGLGLSPAVSAAASAVGSPGIASAASAVGAGIGSAGMGMLGRMGYGAAFGAALSYQRGDSNMGILSSAAIGGAFGGMISPKLNRDFYGIARRGLANPATRRFSHTNRSLARSRFGAEKWLGANEKNIAPMTNKVGGLIASAIGIGAASSIGNSIIGTNRGY